VGRARIGAIELLFLFAPLVIVPLGMELGRVLGVRSPLAQSARRLQPLGAALAVVAMWLPVGTFAGFAACGWMVVCGVAAADGMAGVARILWRRRTGESPVSALPDVALCVARIDLAVGGAWLVASRLGWRPMGIQEPIGLLTAVHFHFAGFATATIAAATLVFAEKHSFGLQSKPSLLAAQNAARNGAPGLRGTQIGLWLRRVVMMVLVLPFFVAAGFVTAPVLKMMAAALFSASVAALAVLVRAFGRRAQDATARVLLQIAAGAVFAGMVLAGVYVVSDFLGSDAITIPQMARTHGLLNAVGFCLPGLLGWLVENDGGVQMLVKQS